MGGFSPPCKCHFVSLVPYFQPSVVLLKNVVANMIYSLTLTMLPSRKLHAETVIIMDTIAALAVVSLLSINFVFAYPRPPLLAFGRSLAPPPLPLPKPVRCPTPPPTVALSCPPSFCFRATKRDQISDPKLLVAVADRRCLVDEKLDNFAGADASES